MESAQPLELDLTTMDADATPIYQKLGLLNGLLIGLALGLGAWGQEILRVLGLPLRLYLPTMILGMVLLLIAGGLTGWLTSRIGRTWLTIPLWIIVALVAILLIGNLGFQGRTLLVWLADSRYWGRDVFPNASDGTNSGLILGGFPIMLILGGLGLLQNYRLENMVGNLKNKNRLDGRAWLALLLPLPLVFAASLMTRTFISDPSAVAAGTTYQAIERARAYEGDDLDELASQEGVNYGALEGVREQLTGDYSLGVAEISPMIGTVTMAADFDNGAWIYCRLFGDQLNFCFDASPPYTVGLRSLLTGEPLPDPCRGCLPRNAEEWADQLAAYGELLGPDPQIERLEQWGSHVLMRAESGDGQTAVECWYEGITRINIVACAEGSTNP